MWKRFLKKEISAIYIEREREARDIGGVREIFAVKGRSEKSLEKKVYIVRKVGRHVGR
jgi:hypothetical protein